VDSKAEYSALSSTCSQKKKLKQTTPTRNFMTAIDLHFVSRISCLICSFGFSDAVHSEDQYIRTSYFLSLVNTLMLRHICCLQASLRLKPNSSIKPFHQNDPVSEYWCVLFLIMVLVLHPIFAFPYVKWSLQVSLLIEPLCVWSSVTYSYCKIAGHHWHAKCHLDTVLHNLCIVQDKNCLFILYCLLQIDESLTANWLA